jgi:lysophospholipase L1-like esterase
VTRRGFLASAVAVAAGAGLVGAGVVLRRRANDGPATAAPSGQVGAVAGTPASLAILHAGLAARQSSPCRLVFAGSSTTAGDNASDPAHRYVDLLVARLQAAYPSGAGSESEVQASTSADFGSASSAPGVHGYNAGDGGTTAADYLGPDEVSNIAALDPRMVLHMVGSNDFRSGVSPTEYRAYVTDVVTSLQAQMSGPCVHVLVQSYQGPDTVSANLRYSWSGYGQALADIAAGDPAHVAFIDISGPYRLLGVPGDDPRGLIDTDQIHQTDAGHALMADTLWTRLAVV